MFRGDRDQKMEEERLSSSFSSITSDEYDEGMDIVPVQLNLPWHRGSTSSPASSASQLTHTTARNQTAAKKLLREVLHKLDTDISMVHTDLVSIFKNREDQLNNAIQESKANVIEHFLQVEFEKQHVDLTSYMESAVLSDEWESKMIKMDLDNKTFEHTQQRMMRQWYKKAIIKYENFFKRVKVIRAAFLRTFEFFREVTESNLSQLCEKQAREVLMLKTTHSIQHGKNGPDMASQHLDVTQLRERHSLELSNIREMDDKTSAREMGLLEFHLKCTEEIVSADMSMFRKIVEKRLEDHKNLEDLLLQHKNVCFETEKIDRHQYISTMRKINDRSQKEQYTEIQESRRNDSERRRISFSTNGKSIANDALYKLTFHTKTSDYVSDSLADSDDSDEYDREEDGSDIPVAVVPVQILMMRRRLKRQEHQRKQTEKKQFEGTIHTMRKQLGLERRVLVQSQRHNIEEISRGHMQKLNQLETNWSVARRKLVDKQTNAIIILKQRHDMDRQIIIDINKENISNARLESEMHAQQLMSAHVFHEVRNVLASMLAISDSLEGCNPEELEQLASRQKTICNYAVETMNNMLDITRYQSGSYRMSPVPVYLHTLIQHISDIQRDRVLGSIEFIQEAPTRRRFLIDRHVLTQLLVNLLSNSAKFTTTGGIKIISRISPVDDAPMSINDTITCQIEFGVADTGSGISVNAYNGDFNELPQQQHQHEKQRKDSEYSVRSTGYGMYLSKLISTILKTRIQVISPLPLDHYARPCQTGGPGSYTFINLLCEASPLHVNSNGSSQPSPSRHEILYNSGSGDDVKVVEAVKDDVWFFNPIGTLRILIADDQHLVRICLMHLLVKLVKKFPLCKVCITTVRAAEEAARLIPFCDFDIIFMDQHFDQAQLGSADHDEKSSTMCEEMAADIPVLELDSTSGDDLNSKVRLFSKNEIFHSKVGDGVVEGVDFVRDYTGNGLCILATGSPIPEMDQFIYLIKPYSLTDFIQCMEVGLALATRVRKKLVHVENTLCLATNKQTVLYVKEVPV